MAFGNYVWFSGYLFSSDILLSMERYNNQIADRVIEKATKLCKEALDYDVGSLVISAN